MSGSTVLAAGGATVTATGAYTSIGLAQVASILNQAYVAGASNVVVLDPNNPTIPAAGGTGPFVLIVPNGAGAGSALNLTIPTGYAAVILGQGTNANVTTTDASTQIVSSGTINFSGAAALVDVTGGTGVVNDTLAYAVLDIGGGSYSVTAGTGELVQYDNGHATINAGAGDRVVLGDGFLGGTYLDQFPAGTTVTGAVVSLTGAGDVVTVNSLGNLIVDTVPGNGSSTITALYGSSTVFAGTGDVYQATNSSAVTEFIGSGSTQTVFGGTGNDTVFGQAGSIDYIQGSGAHSYFIGGSGNATVSGSIAGGGAVFGGSGNTLFQTGNSNDYFIGGSGRDTVSGGSAIPSVFGGSNEYLSIAGSHVAFALPEGSNDTIDASGTDGGTNFFALGSIGNATLIGNATAAAPDTFQIVSAAGAVAHTITIQNWHTGDGLFLQGYGAADATALATAFNGGGTSVTLSDGTTITFDGAHPTHAGGGVAF